MIEDFFTFFYDSAFASGWAIVRRTGEGLVAEEKDLVLESGGCQAAVSR